MFDKIHLWSHQVLDFSLVKVKVVSNCLWPNGLYSSWDSPDQNTGVGSLSLLQGIFPAQGSNPGLLHCRQVLYQLSHREAWMWGGNLQIFILIGGWTCVVVAEDFRYDRILKHAGVKGWGGKVLDWPPGMGCVIGSGCLKGQERMGSWL